MKTSRSTQFALLIILAIAAVLRFQNLPAIEHNVDHAYPIWQALMTLDRGVWPVTAQGTSVLFANPPLTGYLLLPWVALTRSPIGAYLFVIVLNTLAVWLVYRAAAMLLDEGRALIAAWLMAINPWVIEYSRTTWVQALIPFFVCLIFWLLIPVFQGQASRPARRVILALIAATAMTQTYLLAFVALVPVSLALLLFRKRIPWRSVAAGALLFAICTVIYGLGLAANNSETLSRLRDFTGGQARLSSEAWQHAVRLVSGENYAAARGTDAPISDSAIRESLSEIVHAAILVAVLAGIAVAIFTARRRRQTPDPGLIVLIWFAVPVLMMSYVSKPVHPFYLLLTLPAGYILAAQGAGTLLRWRAGMAALVLAAVPITLLLGLNTVRYAEKTLAHPGLYQLGAMPVGPGIEVVHTLLPASDFVPGTVVFADVDEWTLNSLAGRLFPVDRDVHVSQTAYIPTGGAIYLGFVDPAQAVQPVGVAALDQSVLALRDGTHVERFRLDPRQVAAWQKLQPQQPIRSDKGITYLGTQIEQPPEAGKTASLITTWRIDSLAPDRGDWLLGPFVHVYDSTGKRVAIGSGAVIPGAAWRLGEVQIQRLTVPIPADAAGPFSLQIGQYDGVHNLNVLFALPDGTNAATVKVTP